MHILSIDDIPALYTFEEHGSQEERTPESSDCVSVSTIKDYVASSLGFSNYDVDFSSPEIKLKAWLGLAFEDRLRSDLKLTEPDHIADPPELFSPSGRVIGHPDGLFLQGLRAGGDWGVDEFKQTWTSIKHYETEEGWRAAEDGMSWHYQFQAKSYVALYRAHGVLCNEARIWVAAMVGDYSKRRHPVFKRTHFGWTNKELEMHAELLESEAGNAWAWKQSQSSKARKTLADVLEEDTHGPYCRKYEICDGVRVYCGFQNGHAQDCEFCRAV